MGLVMTMAGLSLAGCASHEQRQEISRHPSPDFATEAVVIRTSGRQTVCTVYLTLPGNNTEKANQVFKGALVEGLSVNWLSASSLEIRYRAAHVERFQPVWEHAGHTVRLWMVEEAKQGAAPSKDTRSSITSCS